MVASISYGGWAKEGEMSLEEAGERQLPYLSEVVGDGQALLQAV